VGGREREDGSYSEPNGSQQWPQDEASKGKEDIADGRVNDEQEAGVEVSAERDVDEGAEEAQAAMRDLMQTMTQRAEEAAARLAAANDVQDSGDTKEEGETGNEEQEAEEKGGEVKGQAGPSLTAAESGGGCACSFSPSPDDRAPAKRERKMSDVPSSMERGGERDGMDEGEERDGMDVPPAEKGEGEEI
jgi:hypothetical protein